MNDNRNYDPNLIAPDWVWSLVGIYRRSKLCKQMGKEKDTRFLLWQRLVFSVTERQIKYLRHLAISWGDITSPKFRLSGVVTPTVPVGYVPPPLFWGWILLILRSPKGGCCSISDDLSCSCTKSVLSRCISNFLCGLFALSLFSVRVAAFVIECESDLFLFIFHLYAKLQRILFWGLASVTSLSYVKYL